MRYQTEHKTITLGPKLKNQLAEMARVEGMHQSAFVRFLLEKAYARYRRRGLISFEGK